MAEIYGWGKAGGIDSLLHQHAGGDISVFSLERAKLTEKDMRAWRKEGAAGFRVLLSLS